MIFDSECHALGRHAPKKYTGPQYVPRTFDVEQMKGFPPGVEPEDNTDNLLTWMDHFDIQKSVVMRGLFRHTNEGVVQAIRRHPQRLVGFATYGLFPPDPASPRQTRAAMEELERGIAGGCLGVGEIAFHDLGERAEDVCPALRPVLDFCASRELPVFFHTGSDQYTHYLHWIYPGREDARPGDQPYRVLRAPNALRNPALIEDLAYEFPTVPLIIGHMGKKDFTFLEAALMVARRFPRVFLSTSNTAPDFLERAVREIGAERVIFGTDWKCTDPETALDDPHSQHRMQLDLVMRAKISDAEREAILGRNLERLLAAVGHN